ncbi:MAG: YgjV family protein [Glaciecola sp.]|jgi:hypothetical protein|nr:YgjV family protein [Glaciecola sp.]MDG2100531.1 YgjV family protein [Glaciecola sp.]
MTLDNVWVAEAFGFSAILFNIVGYRSNNMRSYLILSGGAMLCLSAHFFMLDAMAAGIGCGLAAIRNAVTLAVRGTWVLVLFISLSIGFFIYEWVILQHGYIILLAYTSSFIFTAGSILFTDVALMRRWFIFAESIGLVYALAVGSIFGSVFNTVNLCSIAIKMWQQRQHK